MGIIFQCILVEFNEFSLSKIRIPAPAQKLGPVSYQKNYKHTYISM